MPQGPTGSRPGAYGLTERAAEGPQEKFLPLHVPLRTSYFIDSPNKMKENKRKNVFQYQGSNVKFLPPQASALPPSFTALNKNVQMTRNLVTRDAEHPDLWAAAGSQGYHGWEVCVLYPALTSLEIAHQCSSPFLRISSLNSRFISSF